jgi:hypothetical protein
MAETSRSQVTITLGRTGQVITRPGPVFDSVYSSHSHQGGGTKRSIRDRLGGSNDDSSQLSNKRLQLDDSRLNYPSATNYIDDVRLGRDDLRFKIIQSNVLKKSQSIGNQDGVDLREILSRDARPAKGVPQLLPEPRQRFPEAENLRHRFPEVENTRRRFPEVENTRQRFPEAENTRQRFPEAENMRRRFPEPENTRQRMMEAPGAGLPPRRSAESLPQLVDLRSSSYSPWTLERLRQGSSELPRRPPVRTYDDVPHVRKDVIKVSRPIDSSRSMGKSPSTVPIPQEGAVIRKSPYTVDGPYTVEEFLHSLGLDKYYILFKCEEVDMTALRQMRENDLKELGIPMGPRKKILLALMSRLKRRV